MMKALYHMRKAVTMTPVLKEVTSHQDTASYWFEDLRMQILGALESLEKECTLQSDIPPGTFTLTPWEREQNGMQGDFGGGVMGVLKEGRVFEKAGVNVSTVYGQFSEKFAREIPGCAENPNFWASGISLVIHPRNPYVPIVHMNTRFIVTQKSWFGGGMDLTPAIPFEEDTETFHTACKNACDPFDDTYYPKFKKWCDEYFYLPHRNEPRGIGGIFYDYVEGDFDPLFAFTQSVGSALRDVYPEIVRRRFNMPYGDAEKEIQLKKRGRYTEFNLIHDRGTHFGLKTGGNIEAILMSLPPVATWR